MPEIEHPQKRKRLSGSVRVPEEPRVWDVGVHISAAIRRFNGRPSAASAAIEDKATSGSHASSRPHVRSGHWHTYWTGPRDAVFPLRKPVMRWIPPLPMGMDWKGELPTNIRVVCGRKNVNGTMRILLYCHNISVVCLKCIISQDLFFCWINEILNSQPLALWPLFHNNPPQRFQ